VVTYLNPLDAETLRAILTEPKNSIIKQYNRLFEIEAISLTIDNDVYDFMVTKAMEYNSEHVD
jgi:ATP-dependent Clp protease ATP-binding subunit ClpX